MLRKIEGGDMTLDVLKEADIVEQSHDFMVESNRARLVIDLGGAIDAERCNSGLAKKIGGHGSGGAEANNDDLIIVHSNLFDFSC
ncbi:hypothetical protein J2T08_005480 [Neorhizobium galegae]|nr:hypothetical protein [Neorhizobium galegae]